MGVDGRGIADENILDFFEPLGRGPGPGPFLRHSTNPKSFVVKHSGKKTVYYKNQTKNINFPVSRGIGGLLGPRGGHGRRENGPTTLGKKLDWLDSFPTSCFQRSWCRMLSRTSARDETVIQEGSENLCP